MSRRRKSDEIDEGLEFDTLFGAFQSQCVEQDNLPMFKVVVIGEDYAQPCHCCGEQPALHIANFKDKEGHPNGVYIGCSHCTYCDGEWYASREAALEEWNRVNIGSRRRDKSKKDVYDCVREIMDNFKITD